MKTTSSIIAGFILVSPVLAAVATCSRDNLFRCLYASPTQAVPYCSSVLGISDSTTYVSTTTPVATSITTITSTALTTETLTAVSTIEPQRRDLEDRAAASSPPRCVTNQNTVSPAARITSACSCLGITSKTITLTSTSPTSTIQSTSVAAATSTSIVQPACFAFYHSCTADSQCCQCADPAQEGQCLSMFCSAGTCLRCFEAAVQLSCNENVFTTDQCIAKTNPQCCSSSSYRQSAGAYVCN